MCFRLLTEQLSASAKPVAWRVPATLEKMPIINYNCIIKNIRVRKLKQLSIPVIVMAGMLSACGGGGGSSGSGGGNQTAGPPAAPSTYSLQKHTVNDFESRLVTPLTVSGGASTAAPYRESSVTTTANADGSYTQAFVYDSGGERTYIDFSADGGRKTVGEDCNYVYTPAFTKVPGTLALGQSWDTSTVRTCTDDSRENTAVNAKGSVTGIESVTVAAGTFNALKTVTAVSYKFKPGTTLREETCWRDTITGLDLKCNVAITNTPLDATVAVTKRALSWELGGYAQASTGRQKLNVERFAGKWQVWFKGTNEGVCAVDITTTGTVSGTCNDSFGFGFGLGGTVDAQGTAKFSLTSAGLGGPGFSGSFESPLKISGTWSAGTDNGTWYMLHL